MCWSFYSLWSLVSVYIHTKSLHLDYLVYHTPWRSRNGCLKEKGEKPWDRTSAFLGSLPRARSWHTRCLRLLLPPTRILFTLPPLPLFHVYALSFIFIYTFFFITMCAPAWHRYLYSILLNSTFF